MKSARMEGLLVSALLLLAPRFVLGCHWISEEDSLKLTTAFLPCTCIRLNGVNTIESAGGIGISEAYRTNTDVQRVAL
jgi:hypothetical protein